ncbi:MAG: hypothetical protein Q7U36_03230 [bacterium]|nr:hypothetical protein [bacterium]
MTRSERKRESNGTDRRSQSQKKKDRKRDKNALEELVKAVIDRLPRKDMTHVNKEFVCNCCHLHYCVAFDGNDVFCRECFFVEGCLKKMSGNTKTCNYCEGKEMGSESHVMH